MQTNSHPTTQPPTTLPPVFIQLEFTPNPNTLKYAVNRTLTEKGAVFVHTLAMAEEISPLTLKLFAVPGIQAVMIGKDFVTVTKSEEGDWDLVHQSTSKILDEYLSQSQPLFTDAWLAKMDQGASTSSANVDSDDVRIIKELLDRDIRPAVAMDGGDITFDRYEDGVLYVYLQGSCAGCPSSTATLKMGIEARLKEQIPSLKEVVSI